MLERYVRPPFQTLFVNRLLPYLAKSKWIKPNNLTLLSGGLGILFVPVYLHVGQGWAILVLLLSGYLDILDGALARALHQSSQLGCVLDIVTDRWVEFCVVLAFFWGAPETRGMICLFMLGSILLCVTSFLVVSLFSDPDTSSQGKSFHYSPGLMERPEAFFFFVLMIAFPAHFAVLGWTFCVLVCVTTGIRVAQFARQVHALEPMG